MNNEILNCLTFIIHFFGCLKYLSLKNRNQLDKNRFATMIMNFWKILIITITSWHSASDSNAFNVFKLFNSCTIHVKSLKSSLYNGQLWKFNYASPWTRVRGHNVRRLPHCRWSERASRATASRRQNKRFIIQLSGFRRM